MKLTEQEIGMGLILVTCACCGEVNKAHKMNNACSFSLTPNYGCCKCQGIPPKGEEKMASSTAQPMPETIEAYKALAQRDHDLIVEMKAIIGKQNVELNQLRQENKRLKNGRKGEV